MASESRLDLLPRRLLAVALLAAIGPAEAALSVNPRGTGQVLLFPYYTVNAGNDTYLSVTNTSNRGKALKLRFRESRNSRPTLEFSIYLSPYDVWTGALFALDADGPANLVTADTSCTVPAIRTSTSLPQLAGGGRYVPFRNFSYSGANADGGDPGLARSREGHIELIEMGTLRSGPAPTQVLEEITHTSATGNPNTGVPVNCNRVIADWDSVDGAWGGANGNRQLDIDLPTGGLYGTVQIINVANGTLHAYDAEAIEGFYGGTAAPGGLHQAPGNGRPDLADASNGSATVETRVYDVFWEITSTWQQGTADAVSGVLMSAGLFNEFDTETPIGASSEWIITFPTRSYYTDRDGAALLPFTDGSRSASRGCESESLSIWDREELPSLQFGTDTSIPPQCNSTASSCTPFCAPLPPECAVYTRLCGSATALSFQQDAVNLAAAPTAIFGSRGALNRSLHLNGKVVDRGHARLAFPTFATNVQFTHLLTSLDGDVYQGLPAIGFAASNYVNGNAQPGKLANYSAATKHRRIQSIVGS